MHLERISNIEALQPSLRQSSVVAKIIIEMLADEEYNRPAKNDPNGINRAPVVLFLCVGTHLTSID